MQWVDEIRTLKVRANADTPHDAKVAIGFGGEGIGLCRTEHMFFDETRIDAMREMILVDRDNFRKRALDKLMPMQKADFIGIFKEMRERPVTIRLLDPPLHEFLPKNNKELLALSKKLDLSFYRLKRKAKSLDEFNPMLGFRGSRLGVAYPEIYEMQVRAILEAACEVEASEKIKLKPEIMLPIIGDAKEFEVLKELIQKTNPEFMMLSGDDGTYVDFLTAGGHGVISVASHIIPQEMIAWKSQVATGKFEVARASIQKYMPLINHLSVEANPIPVKMALYYMGVIKSPELRLPLVTMAEDLALKMKAEMKSLGVI